MVSHPKAQANSQSFSLESQCYASTELGLLRQLSLNEAVSVLTLEKAVDFVRKTRYPSRKEYDEPIIKLVVMRSNSLDTFLVKH